jgi:RNA polymerase sigma factor (TIGR02999 family)
MLCGGYSSGWGAAIKSPSSSFTALLLRWRGGDQDVLKTLMPMVYGELRQIAHHYLQGERSDHTLQSAALVHEAYLRLVDQRSVQVQDRAHFFAVAARLMREILVDHARSRRAKKRGPQYKVSLDDVAEASRKEDLDLLKLDECLGTLARLDPQQARIVELRFFGGLTIEETSEVLHVSPATVKRDWATARGWLYREMRASTTE